MGRMLKLTTALTLLALVLSSIPAVEAQDVVACGTTPTKARIVLDTIGADNAEIKPITGLGEVTAKFNYVIDGSAKSLSAINIKISASQDKSWIIPTLQSQSQTIVLDPQQSKTEYPFTVKVAVAVGQDAPAFDKGNVIIKASAEGGTCVTPASETPANFQLQAGFYENYQARFQQAIWKTGQNEKVQIPLIIDNYGNGPIRVTFKAAEGTSNNLNFALPGPQIVESTRTGENSQLNIPIDIQTPFKNGYENRRDQFNLEVAGSYAFDTETKLEPLQLNAVIQTQGVYVPGFEAVSMLAAVLGAVLLSMRRREA